MKVLCPACGLPAESIAITLGAAPIRLIGCPCASNRPMSFWLPLLPMTDNHDPGDEDPNR